MLELFIDLKEMLDKNSKLIKLKGLTTNDCSHNLVKYQEKYSEMYLIYFSQTVDTDVDEYIIYSTDDKGDMEDKWKEMYAREEGAWINEEDL